MNKELLDYEYEAYKGRKRNGRRPTNWWEIIVFIAWILALIWFATIETQSAETHVAPEPPSTEETVKLIKDLIAEGNVATADVNKPASDPVTYEDWFRANASVISECKITHYCCEPYEHICGTGDGITSTGVPVTAYWTCAVDPSVISYGSEVMVDYGRTVEFWKAQDCGGCIKGNHIDLAVSTHELAEDLGVKYATVYWMEDNHEPD